MCRKINSHRLSLAELQKLFTNAIESIKYRMDLSDNGSRGRLDDANKMFENALKMLENENIGKLAKVIFTVDDPWLNDIVNNLRKAYDGFIEYWRDSDHIEFEARFDALQLAFFCNVFRRLFIDKQLKEFKIEEYLSFILSELIECIREKKAEYCGELKHFVIVLLRFNDQPINQIVQKAFVNYRHELKSASDEREDIEKIVVNWLIDVQTEDSLLQQPLIIICKPMALAESIIKELYRNRFAKYNPFYFDLGFQFDMNSWIPIKLVTEYNREENDPFKLIENGLKRNTNELEVGSLVVITGDPGAGKTLLTHKMAYDYAKSDGNKWGEYDLVILTEFRSTSDRTHETIIDMALHGLEKMTESAEICSFIKENVNKYKLLIILDGYDEAVNGQCRELDDILSSYGNKNKLNFDLIVTRRPTKVISRKKMVTFLDIIGFDTEEKQNEYIEKHFANSEDKDEEIKSVIEKVEGNWVYHEMAETPLLLTFICSFYSSNTDEKRQVELCSNVILIIQQKLNKISQQMTDWIGRAETKETLKFLTEEQKTFMNDFSITFYQLRRNLRRYVLNANLYEEVLACIEEKLQIKIIVFANWSYFRDLFQQYLTHVNNRIKRADLDSGKLVYDRRLKGIKFLVRDILQRYSQTYYNNLLKNLLDKVKQSQQLLLNYPDDEYYCSNSSVGSGASDVSSH